MKQHTKLLLGFVFGVIFGLIGYYNLPASEFAFMGKFSEVMTFLGATFLRMIFMVVVPLILSALMLGTMELGRGAGLGKVGGMSLLYTVLLSGCAVMVAVISTNLLKPGVGLAFDKAALATNSGVLSIQKNVAATQAKAWYQYIVDLLPQKPDRLGGARLLGRNRRTDDLRAVLRLGAEPGHHRRQSPDDPGPRRHLQGLDGSHRTGDEARAVRDLRHRL